MACRDTRYPAAESPNIVDEHRTGRLAGAEARQLLSLGMATDPARTHVYPELEADAGARHERTGCERDLFPYLMCVV